MRHTYWEIRALGVEFVVASNEPPESNKALRERLDLPFMLLSDDGAEVARAYNAFHENEPRGRSIARPGMFLIAGSDDGNTILWDHVAPTTRHRAQPSRIIEEILTALGRERQLVTVLVPSEAELDRTIAGYQDPPLGLYRTPETIIGSSLTERDFTRELAMAAFNEVHRLVDEGWTLKAAVPEHDGERNVGQRYIFERVTG